MPRPKTRKTREPSRRRPSATSRSRAPICATAAKKTLEEVLAWYDKGEHPNPHLDEKVKPLKLTKQEQKDLVEFIKACTGDFPPVNPGRLPAG
jgi:cytochrome c peroxidase